MEPAKTQQLDGNNLVGKSLSARGEKTFRGFNPATAEWLEPAFHQATTAEIDAAMALATQASAVLRQTPRDSIAAFLEAIATELLAVGDALIERAALETGLGLGRLTGERTRTVNQIHMFAELVREGSWVDARIDPALPDRKPAPRPDLRRMLVPVGPVVVFAASNFPLAFSVAGGDTISALASRNPVVVKAHPSHPGTSEIAASAIARAVQKAKLPDGTFSMLHAVDPEVSLALVRHPAAAAVAFTGSLRAGRAIFDAAARRPEPIPVYAEMGSINPVFVLPGAVAERSDEIAKGLAASINLGSGQFCTCPGLIVGKDTPAFQMLADRMAALFTQAAPATMLNPGILKGYIAGVDRIKNVEGVRVHPSTLPADPKRTTSSPVLFEMDSATWINDPNFSEEVFGPASIIVRAAHDEELRNVAEALPGSLTISILGNARDLEDHRDLVDYLATKAGRLIFNGYPTGVEVTHAMHHGGPYPATTDSKFTSVGTAAILRFARPICYQNFPENSLPAELRNENGLGIWRMINGQLTKENAN